MDESKPTGSRLRTWILIGVGAAVILFLLGFLPQALKIRELGRQAAAGSTKMTQLEAELARTKVQRDLARAQGDLGLVIYEVNRNNFANAATRSTTFFDALRDATALPGFAQAVSKPEPFRDMLQRRDEISADLARGDQAARQKLNEMYLQFDQALQ